MTERDESDPVESQLEGIAEHVAEAAESARRLARPSDYVFDKSQEKFWDLTTKSLHGEKGVDSSIPRDLWRVEVVEPPPVDPDAPPRRGRPPQRREQLVPPSKDIMRVENDQYVEGATWWPGMPSIIRDWYIDAKGYQPYEGARLFNTYTEPPNLRGDASKAGPWIDHVKKLWPDEREQAYMFDYFAHLIQRPHEKCNAAIVLSGKQGIGKDAMLHPVKKAIGEWNTKGIDPDALFATYNPYIETLMLIVNEVRPSKDDYHATTMYNILKPLIAAPPDTLAFNQKYEATRYVINLMRVILTTNDWMDMFIPPEDRRMFVAHSQLPEKWNVKEGKPNYFYELFEWFDRNGGNGHVRAWLAERDISEFNPKGDVVRTQGWQQVTESWGEYDDVVSMALDAINRPDIVIWEELVDASFDHADELNSMARSRKLAHRMTKAGYMRAVCPEGLGEDGRWVFRAEGLKKPLRVRLVFHRADVNLSPKELVAKVVEHGNAWAAKRRRATSGGF